MLKTYGAAPYAAPLKKLEQMIKERQTSVNEKIGVKESDTGLAPPHLWDVAADRQRMQEEQPLQVARCTKIIQDEKDPEKSKYLINVKQIAKFVVNLGERVSPTDIEEGMRVGCVKSSKADNYDAGITDVLTEWIGINTRYCFRYRLRSTPALQ